MNALGSSCANNEVSAPYNGNGCTGFVVQRTPPGHPEQTTQGQTPPSLAIDYIAVGEPPNTSNLMFVMKTTSLATVPPNSRWRIVWNSYDAPGEQFYAGMRSDQNSAVTFEYGSIATAVVGLVLGVPTETKIGNGAAGSNMNADGTITIVIPKSAVGNPQPGDLLGAVNGRTFTGDTPETTTLERSNALMDHTFAKAQRDNGHPAATYTILGNSACEGGIIPLSAVSRKTHGGAGTFDIDLPLSGSVGIEPRVGGSPTGNHTIVVTFPTPVTAVASATCAGNAATTSISGNQVTVNCTGVPNAQTVAINLTGVNDGTNIGNVSIPMGVLLGDVTANKVVSNTDVSLIKSQVAAPVTSGNFRNDVTANGVISNTDVSTAKTQVGTTLP
jgi:hypothetical protein